MKKHTVSDPGSLHCGILSHLLLPVLYLLSISGFAQTYFYIDAMDVVPVTPTTADQITLNIHGGLSSTGAYITNVQADVDGSTVHVTIGAADDGGFTVIVPHTIEVDLGQLPAGTYTVHIMGPNVLDSAPAEDHEFIVSGGASCDSLSIVSIQYHAFNDTMIMVHVTNDGTEIFSYPGFILFDENGDTVAVETVNLFGIGTESTHILTIHANADLSFSAFSGTLELWTDFFSNLACTFSVDVELCPPAPCAPALVYFVNLGGAMAIGTFTYSIFDQDEDLVANGEVVLTGEMQYSSDSVCLVPGDHTLVANVIDPPSGGQVWVGMTTINFMEGPQIPVSPADTLAFSFYSPCVDISNVVEPLHGADPTFQLSQSNDQLIIRKLDGEPASGFLLHDVKGGVIHEHFSQKLEHRIPLAGLAAGVYLLKVVEQDGRDSVHRFTIGY